MADVKISGLPASTVPLAGTEVLPIVQGGATKQVSIANVTAGRSVAALSVITPTIQAEAGSAGGTIKNGSGVAQMQWGSGGASNLSLEVATNINPANAAVNISPTGTGTVTINPATASTMNNVAIGGTTPLAGSFTTATANSFIPNSATIPTNGVYLPAANSVGIATNSAERARLDASGNLGLGVTPSAWGSTIGKALEMVNGVSLSSFQTAGIASFYLTNNAFNDGTNWKYKVNFGAAQYQQLGGGHLWFTAPSGSANANITFTERMSLAESTGNLTLNTGNLVIGTSGKGIDFSATAGTGTSELLNDYEEGTWTPTLGGDATYYNRSGYYTKIGRQVTAFFLLQVNTLGTGSVDTISGLPFAVSVSTTIYGGGSIGYFGDLAVNTAWLNPTVIANSSTFNFSGQNAIDATIYAGIPIFGAFAYVIGSVTYFVD